MAREGILTAIQAALAGLGGGIEGAQQYREMERRQRMQQEALDYQRKRDVLTDARDIRQEQRQARSEGFVPTERLAGMTMPGATPLPSMQPTMRQTIGGQEFSYVPSIAQAERHRADVMSRSLNRAEKGYEQQQEEKLLTRLIGEAKKGGRGSEAAARLFAANKAAGEALFPEAQRVDPLDAMRIEDYKAERAQREAEGMAFLSDNANNQAVVRAYGAAFGRNPNLTPGQIGYALMQQAGKAALTGQREASAEASTARAKGKPGRVPTAAPPGMASESTGVTATQREPSAEEKRIATEKERLRRMYPQLNAIDNRFGGR